MAKVIIEGFRATVGACEEMIEYWYIAQIALHEDLLTIIYRK
jgi:hypothetical protein